MSYPEGLVCVEVWLPHDTVSHVCIIRVWESWCLTQCGQLAGMMLPGTQLRILSPRDPQSEWAYTVPEDG